MSNERQETIADIVADIKRAVRHDMTDWRGRLGVPYQGSKNAIARDIEENSYGI